MISRHNGMQTNYIRELIEFRKSILLFTFNVCLTTGLNENNRRQINVFMSKNKKGQNGNSK